MDVSIDLWYHVVAASKKVAPMVASKKVRSNDISIARVCIDEPVQIANNITKWNQVQEELKDAGGNIITAAPASVVTVRVYITCYFLTMKHISKQEAPVTAPVVVVVQ